MESEKKTVDWEPVDGTYAPDLTEQEESVKRLEEEMKRFTTTKPPVVVVPEGVKQSYDFQRDAMRYFNTNPDSVEVTLTNGVVYRIMPGLVLEIPMNQQNAVTFTTKAADSLREYNSSKTMLSRMRF